MMKVEFDKMEKYWMDKLDSERKFYEKHIQQSDAKFHEFQNQIQTFIDHISNEKAKEDSKQKLPTITE